VTTFFPQGRVFNNYQLQDTITYTTARIPSVRNGYDAPDREAVRSLQCSGHSDLLCGRRFPAFGNLSMDSRALRGRSRRSRLAALWIILMRFSRRISSTTRGASSQT
jgi:hypothetical protein